MSAPIDEGILHLNNSCVVGLPAPRARRRRWEPIKLAPVIGVPWRAHARAVRPRAPAGWISAARSGAYTQPPPAAI